MHGVFCLLVSLLFFFFFFFAILQLFIPKASECHNFLFVGITLLVQIKKEITK